MGRPPSSREILGAKPFSRLASFTVERHYWDIGCDAWTSRRVKLLMAKFGETEEIMAARLRVFLHDFKSRMDEDRWSKQDGLILTILEREIDLLRGGTTNAPSLTNLQPVNTTGS